VTQMAFPRNDAELEAIRAIVASGDDPPVVMLNLNRYVARAGYPDGSLYRRYMSALEALLSRVGAAILWRAPVVGQPVGEQAIDEVLAVWYPTHRTFLELPNSPRAEENYLRGSRHDSQASLDLLKAILLQGLKCVRL